MHTTPDGVTRELLRLCVWLCFVWKVIKFAMYHKVHPYIDRGCAAHGPPMSLTIYNESSCTQKTCLRLRSALRQLSVCNTIKARQF